MLNFDKKGEVIAIFQRNKRPMKIYLDENYMNPLNSHLKYMEKQLCYYCGKTCYDKWNLQRHHKNCKSKSHALYSEIDPLEIKLNHKDGNLQQYPRKDIQEILYVTGIRGSGKSTYVSDYIKLFKKIKPDYRIFLISGIEKDNAFKGIKGILKLIPSEEMVDNDELNTESFRTQDSGSLVIFDDANFTNKKIDNYINNLMNVLIRHGRDHEYEDRDIYVICTSHIVSDYRKTRNIINECSSFTFFPGSGSNFHVENFLKNHCGLAKSKINKLLNEIAHNNTRWMTIYKIAPIYVLYQRGVILLKNL